MLNPVGICLELATRWQSKSSLPRLQRRLYIFSRLHTLERWKDGKIASVLPFAPFSSNGLQSTPSTGKAVKRLPCKMQSSLGNVACLSFF